MTAQESFLVAMGMVIGALVIGILNYLAVRKQKERLAEREKTRQLARKAIYDAVAETLFPSGGWHNPSGFDPTRDEFCFERRDNRLVRTDVSISHSETSDLRQEVLLRLYTLRPNGKLEYDHRRLIRMIVDLDGPGKVTGEEFVLLPVET